MVDISDDTQIVRRRTEATGVVRRRRWNDEEKGRIVAEAIAPGAVIADVARQHDLAPQHLSNWIRAAKEGQFALPADEMPAFVPVVSVESARANKAAHASLRHHRDRDRSHQGAGAGRCRGARRRSGVARGSALQRMIGGMLIPPGQIRVLVATKPVDFRKGMDGLAALVKEQLKSDPFSGMIFCFRSKRADRVKLIFWDGTGLCLFAKRLEGGKLAAHRGRRDAAVGRAIGGVDRRSGLDARTGAANASAFSKRLTILWLIVNRAKRQADKALISMDKFSLLQETPPTSRISLQGSRSALQDELAETAITGGACLVNPNFRRTSDQSV
jgi:transposase